MTSISIDNLYKSFPGKEVLSGISFEIAENKTTAIVGPSGVGKSVLLKLILGLSQIDFGTIKIGGKAIGDKMGAVEKHQIFSQIGVLFQNAALFDSMNLFDNVAFPLRIHRSYSEKEIILRAKEAFKEVNLEGLELLYPAEVSIGIRKKVGIARALIIEPKILLVDEPNTSLDPLASQEIYDLIKLAYRERHFTGLIISHEIPEVFQVVDRVVMLYGGEIKFVGTPEEFMSSEDPVVAQFASGSVNGPISVLS